MILSPQHLGLGFRVNSGGSKGGMKVGEVQELSRNVVESTIGIL